MILHIEIGKGYKKGTYSIRIGDIDGCTELGNVPVEDIIDEVKEACLIMTKQIGERNDNPH